MKQKMTKLLLGNFQELCHVPHFDMEILVQDHLASFGLFVPPPFHRFIRAHVSKSRRYV